MTDAASETARPIVLWQTISKERLDNLECSSLRELGIYGEAQDTWSINLTQLCGTRGRWARRRETIASNDLRSCAAVCDFSNDARGIAQMMRVGLYRPVHVKTLRSQKLRMLLTHRKLLQSKAIAIENDLRGTLRNFGLKVGMVGTVRFEARIKELVENLPDLAVLVEPMLIVRRTLREQFCILHRRLLAIVRDDVCRRLMTTPGVGPVVSLTYRVPPPRPIFRPTN